MDGDLSRRERNGLTVGGFTVHLVPVRESLEHSMFCHSNLENTSELPPCFLKLPSVKMEFFCISCFIGKETFCPLIFWRERQKAHT